MTVATTGYTNSYSGNGAATDFSFTKWLRDKSDLIVTVDGTVKTIGVDYDISGTGPYPSGVTVVFTSPPADETTVLLTRSTPDTQDQDLNNLGDFDQESIELALDKVVANLQEAGGTLSDAVLVPVSLSGSNITLGEPTASEVLAWNATADGIEAAGYTVAEIAADVASADAAKVAAEAAQADAEAAQVAAETAEGNAETHETNAAASAVLAQDWAAEDEDVIVSGSLYSAKHYSIKANDSAELASTTASNLAQTLSGNYISPSDPSVDGNNRFTVVEQMKAFMEAGDQAYIPDSGLTVTWHAWLFNGTSSTWKSQGCYIESNTYSIEANNTDLGTGLIDIDHDDGAPLYLYYNAAKNKVIVTKYVGV